MNITAVIIAAVIVGGTGFLECFREITVAVVDMPDAPALLQQLQREKRKLEAVRSEVHQSQPRLVRLWECLQASRSMK